MTSRRSLLGALGTLSLGSIAGCASRESDDGVSTGSNGAMSGAGNPDGGSGQPNQTSWALDPAAYADRFDSVVNIQEAGADPTGEEPIDSVLQSAVESDTLVFFPPGEYKMTRTLRRSRSQNIGIIGNNAVIRHGAVEGIRRHYVTDGEFRGGAMLFDIGTHSRPHQGDLVFGGFIFDWAWSADAGMQALNCYVDGDLEVRNIQFYGMHSLGTHGNLRIATMSPESTGIVDTVDMRWGGAHYRNTINTRQERRNGHETIGQSWSTTGIACYENMQGTLHFNNIWCGGWPGVGMYLMGGDGRKVLTNCVSVNSNIASIRVGGRDAWEPVPYLDGDDVEQSAYNDGSVVEQCRAIVDHSPDESYVRQRGIWMRDAWATARNCGVTVSKPETDGGDHAVSVSGDSERATIQNIQVDLQTPGVSAIDVSPQAGEVSVQDVQINTVGWDGGSGVVRGPAVFENVLLNGNPLGDG